MLAKKKLIYSLIANASLLAFLVILAFAFGTGTKYWRIGWYDDFTLVSAVIDTPSKYFGLLFILTIINSVSAFINEFGGPILSFYTYNPDKKIITDFTLNELTFLTNAMFFVTNARYIFSVVIMVSQIDVAFWQIIVQQMVCLMTTKFLLSEKKFDDNYTAVSDDINSPSEELNSTSGDRLLILKDLQANGGEAELANLGLDDRDDL